MLSIGFIAVPHFQVMNFAAMSAFEVANLTAKDKFYDLQIISEAGGRVTSSVGISVETEPFSKKVYDTVIVSGSPHIGPPSAKLNKFLKNASKVSRRVSAICTGTFILAHAGLLDGRRATTHWIFANEFKKNFPQVKMEEDRIYIIDGSIWTSAGMSAGVDLALGMIEKDLGADMARIVARKLVVYHRRAGGQSQHSTLLDLDAKSDRVQTALDYAKKNLHKELSVEQLAEAAHLSTRQFSRAFRLETGKSPAKAVEHLRVEAARVMIESGCHSLDTVARETGFADRERMRRSFVRIVGQPPQEVRRHAREAA